MKKHFFIVALLTTSFSVLISSCGPDDKYEKVNSVKEGDKGDFKIKVAIPLSSKDTDYPTFDWNRKLSIDLNERFWFAKDTSGIFGTWVHLNLPRDTFGDMDNKLLIKPGRVVEIREYDSLKMIDLHF